MEPTMMKRACLATMFALCTGIGAAQAQAQAQDQQAQVQDGIVVKPLSKWRYLEPQAAV